MSRRGKTLVAGHTLRFEGAPFDENGHRLGFNRTGGEGRAKCSCGALSDVLPSAYQRRRWHAAHKDAVR